MELMATSLDKFYKFVYCSLDYVIPEEILGKITLAVSVRDHQHHGGVMRLLRPSSCFADCEGT